MTDIEATTAGEVRETSRPTGFRSRIKTVLIFCFVTFHLFILIFRNPLDLWWKPMEDFAKGRWWWDRFGVYYRQVDRWTERYENFLGVEQGWCMFAPPVARRAPFLATRLDFDDGSEELLLSTNELGEDYFRIGGWRQRKLEDKIVYGHPSSLAEESDFPLWQAYVRWRVREWRDSHPDDPRTVTRVVLLHRRVEFPKPDDETPRPSEPEVRLVGEFNPDGTLP